MVSRRFSQDHEKRLRTYISQESTLENVASGLEMTRNRLSTLLLGKRLPSQMFYLRLHEFFSYGSELDFLTEYYTPQVKEFAEGRSEGLSTLAQKQR